MRNAALASLPFIIAIAGGTIAGAGDIGRLRLPVARLAVTHVAEPAALTEEQQGWLEEHNPFGAPETELPGHRTLIVREGYSLSHNNIDLIADWVSYHLTNDYVGGTETRPSSSAFKPDPRLPATRRAERADYSGWKNVYDRGHQAASADSKGRGRTVIRESFLLSNMTPQASRLNQHRWRLLEGLIQDLAAERSELWVITGPVFVDDDSDGIVLHFVLGMNQVSVPTHYFKIVVAETIDNSGDFEAMAFLVPNEPMEDEFEEYLVSIDRIEELTGYDFLGRMANEDSLEAAIAEEVWATD